MVLPRPVVVRTSSLGRSLCLPSRHRLPIVTEADFVKKSRAAMPQGTADNIIAAYSSVLGGIVLDPALAQIPLDDHGFHRGHAVFDTCQRDPRERCVTSPSMWVFIVNANRFYF